MKNWTGWVSFAGWLMLIIGAIDACQGLIAIIRDKYYVLTPSQVIIFDVTTWGWLTLIWGAVVAFAGWSLLSRSGWARWFAVVIGSLNVIAQLGFVGSSTYTLWALTGIALSIIVIYALIARWDEAGYAPAR